jgi:NhaP-type Na+/H+ or K+/H+ antiporter
MRRRMFFKNIGSVCKMGLLVTFVCFAIYTAGLYAVWKAELLTKWDPKKNDYV